MTERDQISEIRAQVEARRQEEQAGAGEPKPPAVDSDFVIDCLKANEVGDGMLYTALQRDKYLHVKKVGEWLVWSGNSWTPDYMNMSLAAVEDVVDRYSQEVALLGVKIANAAKKEDKPTERKLLGRQSALLKRIFILRSASGRQNCLKCAQTNRQPLAVVGDELDLHPMLLACPNGVIDLTTGKLSPGRPEHYISKQATVEWHGFPDPDPDDPWLKALAEIYSNDQELIAFLQRLFGYGITGLSTEHIFPVMQGRGRNGKSMIIETITQILGDLAGPIPSEMLLDSGRAVTADSATPQIMALKGLRLAIASETDSGRHFSPAKVKWLTGGDTLTGRWPYDKRPTHFRPTHLLVLLTNHKPHAPDNDFAFWERALLIPHKISFVDREPRTGNERRVNKQLQAQLAKHGPRILAWLVEGCLLWQKHGLSPPASVLDATKAYKQDEDLLHDFLEACCVIAPAAEAWSSDLYRIFVKWYEVAIGGKKVPAHKRFSQLLNEREQFEVRKTSGKIKYLGIGVRLDSEYLTPEE